jgi:hypothetical protein
MAVSFAHVMQTVKLSNSKQGLDVDATRAFVDRSDYCFPFLSLGIGRPSISLFNRYLHGDTLKWRLSKPAPFAWTSAIDGPRCVEPTVERQRFIPATSAHPPNGAPSLTQSTCRGAARRWRGGFAFDSAQGALLNQSHALNTSSGSTPSPVTKPLVCIAIPITASSSPCISGLIPFAFAPAVWLWMQY